MAATVRQPLWNARLFGRLELERDGAVTTRFRSERARAVLARLLLSPGRRSTREELASLWEDEPRVDSAEPNRGLRNLSRELVDLRKLLNGHSVEVLLSDTRSVWLSHGVIESDVEVFRRLLARARTETDSAKTRELLRQAVALYETSGPLLPGMYDEWIVSERHQIESQYHKAREQYHRLIGSESPAMLSEPELSALLRDAKLKMVDEAARALGTASQARWFAKFDDDNKVILWLLEQELKADRTPALLRSSALRRYWQVKTGPREMRDYLIRLLDNTRGVAKTPLPFCQMLISFLSVSIGDLDAARRYGERALSEFRRRRDPSGEGGILCTLAWEAAARYDSETSARLNDEAVAAYDRLGNDSAVCSALVHGTEAHILAGNLDTALARCNTAFRIARSLEMSEQQASLMRLRSRILALSGRYADAQREVAQASQIQTVGQSLQGKIDALLTQSGIAECGGKRVEALAIYARTLAARAAMEDRANFAGALGSLLRASAGQPLHEWTRTRAALLPPNQAHAYALAELSGYLSKSIRELGCVWSQSVQETHASLNSRLQAILGKRRYDRARASGRKLGMADSAELAERVFCR